MNDPMARRVARQADAAPYASAALALRDLSGSKEDQLRIQFMLRSGYFHDAAETTREVVAAIRELGEALKKARPFFGRLPPSMHAVLQEAASLGLTDLASSVVQVERPQMAANATWQVAEINDWPRPTARWLALAAIAGGMDKPCGADEWNETRLPNWEKRRKRAAAKAGRSR